MTEQTLLELIADLHKTFDSSDSEVATVTMRRSELLDLIAAAERDQAEDAVQELVRYREQATSIFMRLRRELGMQEGDGLVDYMLKMKEKLQMGALWYSAEPYTFRKEDLGEWVPLSKIPGISPELRELAERIEASQSEQHGWYEITSITNNEGEVVCTQNQPKT